MVANYFGLLGFPRTYNWAYDPSIVSLTSLEFVAQLHVGLQTQVKVVTKSHATPSTGGR